MFGRFLSFFIGKEKPWCTIWSCSSLSMTAYLVYMNGNLGALEVYLIFLKVYFMMNTIKSYLVGLDTLF